MRIFFSKIWGSFVICKTSYPITSIFFQTKETPNRRVLFSLKAMKGEFQLHSRDFRMNRELSRGLRKYNHVSLQGWASCKPKEIQRILPQLLLLWFEYDGNHWSSETWMFRGPHKVCHGTAVRPAHFMSFLESVQLPTFEWTCWGLLSALLENQLWAIAAFSILLHFSQVWEAVMIKDFFPMYNSYDFDGKHIAIVCSRVGWKLYN